MLRGESGRGGEIRTHDPLYPKQVRYQTAPRPDRAPLLPCKRAVEKHLFASQSVRQGSAASAPKAGWRR